MLLVALLFGLNFTFTKLVLDAGTLGPQSLMLLRLLFGTVAFWTASLFIKSEKIEKGDRKWVVLAACLGIVINQMLFLLAMEQTSPIDASIITTIVPIITMIVSFFYLREPISTMKAGGVALGASGALAFVYLTHSGLTGEGSSFWGNIMVIGSSFSYSCFFVFSRGISRKYTSITVMKWMFLISTMITFPFLCQDFLNAAIWTQPFNGKNIGLVAYILIGATFLSYLLVPVAQRYIRPTTMSMYNYVQPMVASFLGVWLGQGTITFPKVMCALCIFVGVFFVTRSRGLDS